MSFTSHSPNTRVIGPEAGLGTIVFKVQSPSWSLKAQDVVHFWIEQFKFSRSCHSQATNIESSHLVYQCFCRAPGVDADVSGLSRKFPQ